jgi:hypothetical protein
MKTPQVGRITVNSSFNPHGLPLFFLEFHKENAVKRRLFTHKIIPFISRVALYTHDDLEAIKPMSKRGPRVETPSPGALYVC